MGRGRNERGAKCCRARRREGGLESLRCHARLSLRYRRPTERTIRDAPPAEAVIRHDYHGSLRHHPRSRPSFDRLRSSSSCPLPRLPFPKWLAPREGVGLVFFTPLSAGVSPVIARPSALTGSSFTGPVRSWHSVPLYIILRSKKEGGPQGRPS